MTASRKQARRAAVEAEKESRWKRAAEASPLTRDAFEELLDSVADRVAREGHRSSFEFVDAFLGGRGIDPEVVHAFLAQHGVTDDFSLIVSGDPCRIFGPTALRKAWMPPERSTLEQLIVFVDSRCREHGCDHSHRFTRAFLEEHGLPVGTEMALLAQGGGCDCEVVLNVDPEVIFG